MCVCVFYAVWLYGAKIWYIWLSDVESTLEECKRVPEKSNIVSQFVSTPK